jgi:hypothetical protein
MAAVKDNTKSRFNASKLTPDQVLMILTRKDITLRQLADMMNVSFSTIQKVWQGNSHRHIHPEIPRSHQRTVGPRCPECIHYFKEACSMSFPEFRTQGITAAALCSAYATGRIAVGVSRG